VGRNLLLLGHAATVWHCVGWALGPALASWIFSRGNSALALNLHEAFLFNIHFCCRPPDEAVEQPWYIKTHSMAAFLDRSRCGALGCWRARPRLAGGELKGRVSEAGADGLYTR